MTGRGRCQRRRKSMAGGRGAAESKKSGSKNNIPNLKPEITEKPLGSPRIRKVPPTSTVQLDLYTQACKALSFRPPFDSEDSQASSGFASTANILPSGVSHLLSRHSDSRKRQKRLHSSTEKKSSTSGGNRGGRVWIETEDYFRGLTVEDIEKLEKLPRIGLYSDDKCFLIPSFSNDGNSCDRLDMSSASGMLSEKNSLGRENGVEANGNGSMVQEENGRRSMDIDGHEEESKTLEAREESSGDKRPSNSKDSLPFSGVEWLLGSRSKIYLATERPSKKRKLLGRGAGLEKLHVARPVEGLEAVCHYCNYGETGDPLNCLIKCSSCCVVVHQRCYGVQEDADASWVCSWCKWEKIVDLNTETPCLVCPKQGGALKPVRKSGCGSDESKKEFAHLFCCQWMPELYLENTRTMEPIMNIDELTDARRKLLCYLCKVKYGACVRCSNGSCRTSFHPICAREARHRMEIWGNLGTDEVELRAFCSKHSEVEHDHGSQDTQDISPTAADQDLSKHNEVALDGEELLDHTPKFETDPRNGDASHHFPECSVDCNYSEFHACAVLNFKMILKKLLDLGKINVEDLASEIGVLPDSPITILTDNHIVPELRCKLLGWLKNQSHIGNLQQLKVKIGAPMVPNAVADAVEGVGAVSVEESSISDSVPVKSVPLRRRTKSNIRPVRDDKAEEPDGEDSNDPSEESLPDDAQESFVDPGQHQDNSAAKSMKIEDELIALLRCLSEDGLLGEAGKCHEIANSSLLESGEVKHASYIHPIIHRKLMQIKNDAHEKTSSYHFAVSRDHEASQLEASSTSASSLSNRNLQETYGDNDGRCDGVNGDEAAEARSLGLQELSPVDEVEGELIYYQQRLLNNALTRKRISDELILKVVRSLTQEMDATRRRKWDDVLVSQYIHELREAKKQGRKERRHKEAQAVLAAATAAAAASSRVSSVRKDNLEDSSRPELKKEAISRPRSTFEANSESSRLASNDQPSTCDICRRTETVLNPILICARCKVAVHLDCYRSVRSTSGPWLCELCEELFSSQGSEAVVANSSEKPYFVAECSLCGGTAGAFRKSTDGQWIHAFCAEWVSESTYRRGQLNPVDGMDRVGKGVDTCTVCHRIHGVCLKCSYGHCQTMFHPTCAKSAGYYMSVRTNGGKLQHKAYCEKHSGEQRAKAETQRHGVDELKSLKQVRVELERLRLLCERIVKREKLKRELVLCSHSILATSRDSVLSALAQHPYYQPECSSESATTSIKGYTDDYKSGSELVQRSDDITVDSTVTGKRRIKFPIPGDMDQKTEDSSTSQTLYTLKPTERVSFAGKHIPKRHVPSPSPSDNVEKNSKYRKPPETFEKELLMTSDQASMKNQRLPKGFVYVPVRNLSKDKDKPSPDERSKEPTE
ncbi:uncharacterized protein LOC127256880 isoform X2 [Andrographis paniculata]|uniref:uncharacterized protein LOC127256880 isoform X2 n=1 Tax=Andrographis paniculata TaxID=175694 RepID=UPI0021E87AD9|nr:uncharacterized protein LOC127256880 isoform X2 [Andrographis paniculata]